MAAEVENQGCEQQAGTCDLQPEAHQCHYITDTCPVLDDCIKYVVVYILVVDLSGLSNRVCVCALVEARFQALWY